METKIKVGKREFLFETHSLAPNRFNIFELADGKRIPAGDGIIVLGGDSVGLRNIEFKPEYRGGIGAALFRGALRFMAESFPDRKIGAYHKLVKGKPMRERQFRLGRFRKKPK